MIAPVVNSKAEGLRSQFFIYSHTCDRLTNQPKFNRHANLD
ncbi:hypothetical protein [Pseudanabaena sp. UWO311]|nr:hypothetical protein [Pseudanabaena sp. UWO311]